MENSKINYNEVKKLFELPFMDLIYKAHSVHRFQEKIKFKLVHYYLLKQESVQRIVNTVHKVRYNTGLKMKI